MCKNEKQSARSNEGERKRAVWAKAHLVASVSMLGHDQDALDAVGEEVALDVEVFGLGESSADLGGLQVGRGELLGSSELGDEGSVVAGDDAGASTRALGALRLDLVESSKAFLIVGGAELVGEVIIANAAKVGDGVGRQAVLQ